MTGEAEIRRVGEIPSRDPPLVKSMYRLTVSPGPIVLIAVTKPPVLPLTEEGAKVRLRVPVVIDPPDVLDAVAVSAANTLDATIPAPPIAATATNEILRARLPALFESIVAIGFMS